MNWHSEPTTYAIEQRVKPGPWRQIEKEGDRDVAARWCRTARAVAGTHIEYRVVEREARSRVLEVDA